MAKAAAQAKRQKARTIVRGRSKPKSQPLPGLEHRAIQPLEEVAAEYVEIRDQRMELTQREHALKLHALKLMKKYDKTIYRHDGIEITVVPGEDDVKVKVRKDTPSENDDDATEGAEEHAEFAAERAAAVNAEDEASSSGD